MSLETDLDFIGDQFTDQSSTYGSRPSIGGTGQRDKVYTKAQYDQLAGLGADPDGDGRITDQEWVNWMLSKGASDGYEDEYKSKLLAASTIGDIDAQTKALIQQRFFNQGDGAPPGGDAPPGGGAPPRVGDPGQGPITDWSLSYEENFGPNPGSDDPGYPVWMSQKKLYEGMPAEDRPIQFDKLWQETLDAVNNGGTLQGNNDPTRGALTARRAVGDLPGIENTDGSIYTFDMPTIADVTTDSDISGRLSESGFSDKINKPASSLLPSDPFAPPKYAADGVSPNMGFPVYKPGPVADPAAVSVDGGPPASPGTGGMTPQVITKGLDGLSYSTPASAYDANVRFLNRPVFEGQPPSTAVPPFAGVGPGVDGPIPGGGTPPGSELPSNPVPDFGIGDNQGRPTTNQYGINPNNGNFYGASQLDMIRRDGGAPFIGDDNFFSKDEFYEWDAFRQNRALDGGKEYTGKTVAGMPNFVDPVTRQRSGAGENLASFTNPGIMSSPAPASAPSSSFTGPSPVPSFTGPESLLADPRLVMQGNGRYTFTGAAGNSINDLTRVGAESIVSEYDSNPAAYRGSFGFASGGVVDGMSEKIKTAKSAYETELSEGFDSSKSFLAFGAGSPAAWANTAPNGSYIRDLSGSESFIVKDPMGVVTETLDENEAMQLSGRNTTNLDILKSLSAQDQNLQPFPVSFFSRIASNPTEVGRINNLGYKVVLEDQG